MSVTKDNEAKLYDKMIEEMKTYDKLIEKPKTPDPSIQNEINKVIKYYEDNIGHLLI